MMKVISPELIREVEFRMNRNYLPPALKIKTSSNGLSQSPPTNNSLCNATTICSNLSSVANISNNSSRRYGRTCKLPTVQEVGRYSPVRRASEGSKSHFHGPLQECQFLQKGIAQRNFLTAPPLLLENSVSLPGSPVHCKDISNHSYLKRGQIEIPIDAAMNLMPLLDRLVKQNRISSETANNIISTGVVPVDLASHLGLSAHLSDKSHLDLNQMQRICSHNASPLLASPTIGMSATSGSVTSSGPISPGHFKQYNYNKRNTLSQQVNFYNHIPQFASSGFNNLANCGCQLTALNNFSPSLNSQISSCCTTTTTTTTTTAAIATFSPLHQITKGIKGLTTSGGGSITRGTSVASENTWNQPLDLSMEISCNEDTSHNDMLHGIISSPESSLHQLQPQSPSVNNWFMPFGYFDLKPLNLSAVQQSATPPASPNLCIIQEENGNNQTFHSTLPNDTDNYNLDDLSPNQPVHPQICLTDVQGSEITLVALSSENSHDSDSLEPPSSLTLHGLIITEQPSGDMPSITRGVGRKTSLESENNTRLETDLTGSASASNRRGSDKSLGFSDDSLSNDSNNLSPCQEQVSASSGFKSDSHSEIGDQTERLTPDSIYDEYYEVILPYECSNLNSARILEMVKQTIDSTIPPKCFTLKKAALLSKEKDCHMSFNACSSKNITETNVNSNMNCMQHITSDASIDNLNLEYSGGLQIELQVCEGRNKESKGIKLRRISGDQFEYGKLCQQLISTFTV